MTEAIPTEEDWGDYTSDLDWEYAHGIFAGKSNDEVQADFKRAVGERAEELHYMPDVPFRYYIQGFARYVMSRGDDPLNDNEAAFWFLSLIKRSLAEAPARLRPVRELVLTVVNHIADNHVLYDHGNPEIWRFGEEAEEIRQKL